MTPDTDEVVTTLERMLADKEAQIASVKAEIERRKRPDEFGASGKRRAYKYAPTIWHRVNPRHHGWASCDRSIKLAAVVTSSVPAEGRYCERCALLDNLNRRR